MSDFQQAGTVLISVIVLLIFIVLPFVRLMQLLGGRKYDFWCFFLGYYLAVGFFSLGLFSIIILKPELLPEIISSGVIAGLTLALVWVELSKRPELKLLNPVLSIQIPDISGTASVTASEERGQLSQISPNFLGVFEADFKNALWKFDKNFSFEVDVANIGYEEIKVHEYVVVVDGKKIRKENLDIPLTTQERHPFSTGVLGIEKPGLHKLRIEVNATTVKVIGSIWFFVSENHQKIRYADMFPPKKVLSYFISHKLGDIPNLQLLNHHNLRQRWKLLENRKNGGSGL